jgi:hypothetical protein
MPVAIGCEYTLRNLEYGFAEPGEKHVPGTFSPKARKAIVGLVRYIHDEAERRSWPKLYFYPIDEPGNNLCNAARGMRRLPTAGLCRVAA